MRFVKLIFATLLLVLGVIFIIQNLEVLQRTTVLRLNLWFQAFRSAAIPLWILLLCVFFLGVLTTCLYGLYELLKQRQTIRALKHNLEIVGQELKRASAAAATEIAKEPEVIPRASEQ